ncbi:MAG: DUF4912 domain-containing protein [Verrucomicrobiota bacterium]|nr:DUF4912 domain-containing protein [Verrucomicrobiota bacterium]
MPERETNANKQQAFKISAGPVTSPSSKTRAPEGARGDLPMHYGAPQLLAVGRDPETLFVCWSVDWASLFADEQPEDRRAHLRVKSLDSGRTISVAVEPMQGTCAVPNLQPGEKYSVEIGYFAPAEKWHRVAVSNEAELAGEASSTDTIDVATVPFHLTFERMLSMFRGTSREGLAEKLADFQEQAADEENVSAADRANFAEMNMSPAERAEHARKREQLRTAAPLPQREIETFGGFSSHGGIGGPGGSSQS